MNIYAGNLSWELNEDELRQLFEEFGEVSSASIIKDKFSGRSKGFGFIEMPNKEEAESAINSLNGKEVKGRNLKVNEARNRTDDRRERGFGGGRGRRPDKFGSRRY